MEIEIFCYAKPNIKKFSKENYLNITINNEDIVADEIKIEFRNAQLVTALILKMNNPRNVQNEFLTNLDLKNQLPNLKLLDISRFYNTDMFDPQFLDSIPSLESIIVKNLDDLDWISRFPKLSKIICTGDFNAPILDILKFPQFQKLIGLSAAALYNKKNSFQDFWKVSQTKKIIMRNRKDLFPLHESILPAPIFWR